MVACRLGEIHQPALPGGMVFAENYSAAYAWSPTLDWLELDRICDQLDRVQRKGAFCGLSPVALHAGDRPIDADLLARIILADIDHLRTWERTHMPHESSAYRRDQLGAEAQRVLSIVHTRHFRA